MGDAMRHVLVEHDLLELHQEALAAGYRVSSADGLIFTLAYQGGLAKYSQPDLALKPFEDSEQGRAQARAFLAEVKREQGGEPGQEEGAALPRFRVTYTAHLSYATEIAAPSLEEAGETSEEIYTATDFADYGVDGHDENWEPLNEAARRLLQRRKAEESAQERGREETLAGAAGCGMLRPRQLPFFLLTATEVQDLVRRHFGQPDYQVVSAEEWHSDCDYQFQGVREGANTESERAQVEEFRAEGGTPALMTLLCALCDEGVIPAGNYLVSVN